ncbi:MAG: hypothetical protein U0R51_13070 [Solirubrobacterales bacterium]
MSRKNLRRTACGLAAVLSFAAVPAAGAAKPKPKPAVKLGLSAPASVAAGQQTGVTVTALTAKGKPAKDYRGTVTIAPVTGGQVPAAYRFKRSDRGRHVFAGVVLTKAGATELKAAGTGKPAVSGALSVQVTPGPVREIGLTAPAKVTAGQSFTPKVSGRDAYGNPLSAPGAVELRMSPAGKCSGGSCSATEAGDYSVRAAAGGATAQAAVRVDPGPLAAIDVSTPATATAGERFTPVVKGEDAYGNGLGTIDGGYELLIDPSGSCDTTTCNGTMRGLHWIEAVYQGHSAGSETTIEAGPLSRLVLSPVGPGATGVLAPQQPAGANATYSGPSLPRARTWAAEGRDAYGNSLGDVTSQATFTVGGRPCSGSTCTATVPGRDEVRATIGAADGSNSQLTASYESAWTMGCRGENYDVNRDITDGCEQVQPNPGHTTEETAIDLGSRSCSDSASQTSFSGTIHSDTRTHSDVDGYVQGNQSAPVWYRVKATGGICVNDMALTFRTSGGKDEADGAGTCYSLQVRTDRNQVTLALDGNGGPNVLERGSGWYSDNSVIWFRVAKSCASPGPESVDYTVDFRL